VMLASARAAMMARVVAARRLVKEKITCTRISMVFGHGKGSGDSEGVGLKKKTLPTLSNN